MATQRRNALGRGLDALLSMDEVKTEGSSSINEIELSKISVNPNQPRREFDETALQELADSISEIGIIQPITLRKLNDDAYQIIAGERRYRASLKAGLETIPAYIRTADDENVMEMALIENIQREDLNAVEIALAYQHLIEQYELTQERLSERVGKKRTTIANYLRLLKLPAPIQMALQNKQIDMGHARALITLGDPKLQVKIFEEILEHGYSVRKVEEGSTVTTVLCYTGLLVCTHLSVRLTVSKVSAVLCSIAKVNTDQTILHFSIFIKEITLSVDPYRSL